MVFSLSLLPIYIKAHSDRGTFSASTKLITYVYEIVFYESRIIRVIFDPELQLPCNSNMLVNN